MPALKGSARQVGNLRYSRLEICATSSRRGVTVIEQLSLAGNHRINGSLPLCRQKRLAEGFKKIVATVKILPAVILAFRKPSGFDQVEDDRAEIAARTDSPLIEHRYGHGTELSKRVLSNAVEQFRGAYVAFLGTAILAGQPLGGLQSVANK